MNENDIKMFKALSQTETGKWMVGYLEKLSDRVCDVRYKPGTEAETRLLAADVIQEELLDNLVLQNKKKKKVQDEWA